MAAAPSLAQLLEHNAQTSLACGLAFSSSALRTAGSFLRPRDIARPASASSSLPPTRLPMSSRGRRNIRAAAGNNRRFDRARPEGTGGVPAALRRPSSPGRGPARGLVNEIMHRGGVKNQGDGQPAGRRPDVSVVWFRNDLRLRDNSVLQAALPSRNVLPVYVFDPKAYEDGMYGYQKTGEYRALFIQEAVEDLRRNLREKGCDLIVRVGHPEVVLTELIEMLFKNGVSSVSLLAQKDVTWEETRVERAVEDAMSSIDGDLITKFFWNSTMLEPSSLPYAALSEIPEVFSTFRRDVEREFQVPIAIPAPEKVPQTPLGMMIKPGKLPQLGDDLHVRNLAGPRQLPFAHPKAAIDFKGGETSAWDRVKEWIWDQSSLRQYKDTRNGSGINQCSSKFSVFLACGCISAREIWWEVQKYEKEVVSNESTYWLIFELLWRDYFRFNAANQGNSMFSRQGKQKGDYWKTSIPPELQEKVDRWQTGATGVPFVDSHMRELDKTGYMSNRGRQVVASFFIHDIGAGDWRIGAEYFESKLIDYDPCSNWGNWAYLAGVGNDPRGLRRFNPYKQAQQYDADAGFIIKWCPELHRVPIPEIFCPHILSKEELKVFALRIVDADDLKNKPGEPIGEDTVKIPAMEGAEEYIIAPRAIYGYPRPMANMSKDLRALKMGRQF